MDPLSLSSILSERIPFTKYPIEYHHQVAHVAETQR